MSSLSITVRNDDDSIIFEIVLPIEATVSQLRSKLMEEVLIPVDFLDIVDDQGVVIPLNMPSTPLVALGVYDGSIFTYTDKRLYPIKPEETVFVASLRGNFTPELVNFLYVRPCVFRFMLQVYPQWSKELSPNIVNLLQKPDAEVIAALEREHYKIDPKHRRVYLTRQREKAVANGATDAVLKGLDEAIESLEYEEQVEEAYRYSMEHNPEAFIPVPMLYVPMTVNGKEFKAFVDSGAQNTIMSDACARQCGLDKYIDKRYKGVARGVGQSKVLGRIHAAKVKLGNSFISCYFSVIEGLDTDILLGLDQLRKHQMCIDLKRNGLVFDDQLIPFLDEAKLPKGSEIASVKELKEDIFKHMDDIKKAFKYVIDNEQELRNKPVPKEFQVGK